MKIYLDTVGCRLNQSEIEMMAVQFRSAGHEIVTGAQGADLVVVNTCSVTSQAASDSRTKIRQAVRLGAREVILTGCWSTLEQEAALSLPGVRTIIPNSNKGKLVKYVLGLPEIPSGHKGQTREALPGIHKRTRAFIKVQDGCDNHCTFCITTIARGKGFSRNSSEVLEDIQAAIRGGTIEAVLTGVNLGSWSYKTSRKDMGLGDLIQEILKKTDIQRLRLSSLEPWDLDESFFDLWKDARLCRQLHLPLQSGNIEVLRRMARKTNLDSYAHLVASARAEIPDVAITTDLIAGFPGETENEFQESLSFVENMEFSGGHVFTYSSRPGTSASKMKEQVPLIIRKQRNEVLRSAITRSKITFFNKFLGRTMEVLWVTSNQLGANCWMNAGLTDNNLPVRAVSSQPRWNQKDHVELNSMESSWISGNIRLC
jgi:threonylcarbamoyladenosine tRNA methylthiotransferase MtaB